MDQIDNLKIIKNQKNNIEIVQCEERTFIIVVAIGKENNFLKSISCRVGIPISGYVYDIQTDEYKFECNDFLQLGYIPISFLVKVKGSSWQKTIPVAEPIIMKYLTISQKRELKGFKYKYRDFSFEYLQFIDAR